MQALDRLKHFKMPGAVFLMMVLANGVSAAQSGGYLGFSIGTSEVETLNEDDSSFKLSAGYNMNEHLGIEIQAIGFGEFYNGTGYVDVSGVSFAPVGYLPLSRQISILGKLGMVSYTAELFGYEETGSALMYGLGGQLDLQNNLAVRVEWENYNDISGSDISLLSGGIIYTF